MSAFIDNIMERPRSHRIGFWVASIIVIIFVFWQYFYKAKNEQLTELQEEIDDLHNQISYEQRLARSLPRVKAEVKELDIKLKFAMQELPDKKEIPDLLASISDLAMDAGLEVSLFRPKNENFKEFFAEVPVAVAVLGTYHQVATFFDEVGRLPRIVNINRISLKNPKVIEEDISLEVDCLATTFRYLEESERVKHTEKKKGKRRR